MNKILQVSLIAVSVVIVIALGAGLFFAGSMFAASRQVLTPPDALRTLNNAPNSRQDGSQNLPNSPGGAPNNRGNQPDSNRGPRGGGRPDERGGRGPGMGPGMGGQGMGAMPGQPRGQANLTPPTEDEAKKAAEDYIASLKLDGLEVSQVLIINEHAYVVVKETASGNGAFGLVVDPVNKLAHPEPGPATLWNLKYGGVLMADMGGRFGGPGLKGPNAGPTATPAPDATPGPAATPANVSAEMPISQEQAIQAAQTFLDAVEPGAATTTEAFKFYGYYTVTFSKDGNVVGVLMVNGYNGQVLGHQRHKQ